MLLGLHALVLLPLAGGGPALAHGSGLYASEAEAQQRAKQLGCSGVHQVNKRWMPCSSESELHQHLRKQ